MAYKVTIPTGVLQKSIESVTFYSDPPNDFDDMHTYIINTIRINGKIGIDEDVTVLSDWSLIPANNPECYKELTVEQTLSDNLIRKIVFSKAFVISYKESYTDDTGIGHYSLFVRQLATIDIECTNKDGSEVLNSPVQSQVSLPSVITRNKDFEIIEGLRPPSIVNRITVEEVKQELAKSKIGRETLNYIDKNNIKVLLSYKPMIKDLGNGYQSIRFGEYDDEDKVVRTYVTNTKTIKRTAQNVIHEVTHQFFRSNEEPSSKEEEFMCRLRQEKHIYENEPIPLSVMRKHYIATYHSPIYKGDPDKMVSRKKGRLDK